MRTGDEIWALEILEAFEDQGICFLRISVLIDGGRRRYQIGIQREALLAIRSLKEIAVGTGGTLKEKRRFFVEGLVKSLEIPDRASVSIYISQEWESKKVSLSLPMELAENLIWFMELKDPELAAHLLAQPLDS